MNGSVMKEELVKHLPQILSGVAAIGVGAVAYLSGRNSIKAHEILKSKGKEKAPTKEKVKLTWKCYIPTLIALTATITCMIVSQKMSTAQVASMSAACGYFIKQKTELEKKIREEVGEEKYREIKEEVNNRAALDNKFEEEWAEPTGHGDQLCYESFTGRWFYSSEEEVRAGIEAFEKYYSEGDYISYNDLYSELHIAPSYLGNELGWFCSYEEGYSPSEIDFTIWYNDDLVPGKHVLVIGLADPIYYPYYDWMEM